MLALFSTKGNKKEDPFDYLNHHCKVKMALIIDSIFISKTVVSASDKSSWSLCQTNETKRSNLAY